MDEHLREALTMGRELYAQREYARAEPHLASLVAANVPYADVYNMLGVIYHDAGQFMKAQSCFEEALRINPAYTEASLNLAVVYNDMGKYSEAKSLYLGALTSSTKPGAKLDSFVMGKLANLYADIAEVYASAGAWDEAIDEYHRALALRPTFVDIRLKLACALRDAGRPQEALRELRSIRAHNPAFVPARLHLALTLFSVGDATGAEKELTTVVADHPAERRAKLYLDMIRRHAMKRTDVDKPHGGG